MSTQTSEFTAVLHFYEFCNLQSVLKLLTFGPEFRTTDRTVGRLINVSKVMQLEINGVLLYDLMQLQFSPKNQYLLNVPSGPA